MVEPVDQGVRPVEPRHGGPARMPRREFLRRGAALLGTGGLAALLAGCWPGETQLAAPGGKPARKEGVQPDDSLQVMTVKDMLAASSNNRDMLKAVTQTAKEIYGLDGIQDGDWVVAVSKPRLGESVVVNLLGVAQAGTGKFKKGTGGETGMHIQFQRPGDTKPDAIVVDNQHPEADLLHRVNGSNTSFYPFSPAYEPNQHGVKGWADVPFADEQKRPVIVPLAESHDTFFLYVPVGQLKAAKYSPDIANIYAYKADLSYPKTDK